MWKSEKTFASLLTIFLVLENIVIFSKNVIHVYI